jgi:hypothetical protein
MDRKEKERETIFPFHLQYFWVSFILMYYAKHVENESIGRLFSRVNEYVLLVVDYTFYGVLNEIIKTLIIHNATSAVKHLTR